MGHTKKRTPRRLEKPANLAVDQRRDFNAKYPPGTLVWFWASINHGPVYETEVAESAVIREHDQLVLVKLKGIGWVWTRHVRPVIEAHRERIGPIRRPIPSPAAEAIATSQDAIQRVAGSLKRYRDTQDRGQLVNAAGQLREAARALDQAAAEVERGAA